MALPDGWTMYDTSGDTERSLLEKARIRLREAHRPDVYAALDTRNRFAFLNRIQTAVRPETRTRRIEQLTDALAQGKTPVPAPTKKSGT